MNSDPTLESIAIQICDSEELTFGEFVGEGGFKQTFRAKAADGADVALKVFRPRSSSARTQREIDAMERCRHSNIARLHSISEIELMGQTFVYTVEEFLSGGTLSSWRGRMSRGEVVELALSLIDAIAHIASHSLVHRDLKPENILFRENGTTPVIVDFGIVRDLGRSPLTESWIMQGPGTPLYAAPEQLNNQRELIDWRTDQFALAVTLFLMRWGFHPFGSARDESDAVVAAVAERVGPGSAAVELIGEDGLTPLGKMLQPWPIHRYRNPEDLAEAWEKIREGH